MKKILNLLFITVFMFLGSLDLLADDLSPAEAYYRDNIAVTDVSAKSPILRAGDDDDDVTPPGGGTGGGAWVGAPLQDAILPILLAGLAYGSFILINRKSRKSNN